MGTAFHSSLGVIALSLTTPFARMDVQEEHCAREKSVAKLPKKNRPLLLSHRSAAAPSARKAGMRTFFTLRLPEHFLYLTSSANPSASSLARRLGS